MQGGLIEPKPFFLQLSSQAIFFDIQNVVYPLICIQVCRACKLKSSCKFANQRVVKRRKLMAADALRVLSVYGLGSLPQQLVITDEIQVSINKLLKQVVNLSK